MARGELGRGRHPSHHEMPGQPLRVMRVACGHSESPYTRAVVTVCAPLAATVGSMCGRFVSASPPDELARYFGALSPETTLEENYNVAPTALVYGLRADHGHRRLGVLRWGLVPSWADDVKIGARLINARSETVADKPAFRKAYAHRRCLIPADGFYEWRKVPGQKVKQPYFIARSDGEPLVFGGLWERWTPKDADGRRLEERRIESCTILTTAANHTVAPVHDRMPLLIPATGWDDWIDPESDPARLGQLLVPAPEGLLELRPISTAVNRVANNGQHLLDPIEADVGS